MSRELKINSTCPHCGKPIVTTFNVTDGAAAPDVRCSNLKPIGTKYVYRISSEQIADYLTEKVREIVPKAKVVLAAKYCEKRRKDKTEPHRSYAALAIALSDDVVKNGSDRSWFNQVGTTGNNVTLIDDMFTKIIEKFRFDPKDVSAWLDNYKTLEDLENAFGMDETYIRELKKLSVPHRIVGEDGKPWVFFAAEPGKVIRDMLTDPTTGRLMGRANIVDTTRVSRDVVEYIVHLDPNNLDLHEDQSVRAILMGDAKSKKN